MKEELKPVQVTKKRSGGIGFWLFTAMFAIAVSLAVFLQISVFQSFLTDKMLSWISENSGHAITVENVSVRWLDDMVLEGIEIRDTHDSIMISIPSIYVDFDIISLLFGKEGLQLDAVRITEPKIHLIKYDDSTAINITAFIDNLRRRQPKTPKAKNTADLLVSRVKLDNAIFTYNDLRKDRITDKFDYYHFGIDSIHGNFSDLKLKGGDLQVNIINMRGNDNSGYLQVNNLSGLFELTPTSLSLGQMDLTTGHSHIKDAVSLQFANLGNLSYFNDSVDFQIDFKNSSLSTKDIAAFAPQYKGEEDKFLISGILKGKVSRLSSDSLSVRIGQSSYLTGKVYMSGLPDVSETFIDLKVNNGYLLPEDLRPYIKDNYTFIEGIGPVTLQGEFMGFVSDFVANGTFTTRTGFVRSDINIKIPDKFEETEYRGKLVLNNFDLGSILAYNDLFKAINMTGNIRGSGITLENAEFFMEGSISSVTINDYTYSNIQTSGQFASQFFQGSLSVDDPYLQIKGVGTADFRDKQERIIATIEIDTIALQPLNLYHESLGASFQVDIDVENFQIDSLIGYINVNKLLLETDKDYLYLDQINISSTRKNSFRSVRLRSDLLDAMIKGEFLFSDVGNDFPRLFHEYKLSLRNSSDEINTYYSEKQATEIKTYALELEVEIKDLNPALHLFNRDISLGHGTHLSGTFQHGNTSIISFYTTPDTIYYAGSGFFNNELELTISKTKDSTDVLGMALVASKAQNWSNVTKTKNAQVEAVWNGPYVDFTMSVEQVGIDNHARIAGRVDFLTDTTLVKFKPSHLVAFEKTWKFSDENNIVFSNQEVSINNLKLFSDDEYLYINGVLSENQEESAEISISNFNLVNIQPFIAMDYSGTVDGTILLNDAFHSRSIQSDIKISGFYIEKFLVGDVRTASKWENEAKRFRLGLDVHRDKKKVIDIVGYFTPNDSIEQLSLIAELDDARLNLAEPFLKATFTNINGNVDGLFVIRGNLAQPILKGRGMITQGRTLVNYLNTNYNFEGEVFFEENEIGFRQIQLTDADGNKAMVNGGIFHSSFKDFVLDFNGQLSGFQVLNTSAKDNDLYYGTAYATGNISMLGSISNMSINATATTAKGTRLYIPLSTQAVVEQEEFISFVNFSSKDTLKALFEEKKVNLSGIKLDFDLDITTDAYCEIIFDIKSGDIIRGRGNGNLKLQIDTKGDFNMFGDFEIATGAYNFTLYNIINKEFSILAGSRISWYGDPYEGILNINANYRQLASLAPLMTTLDAESLNAPELRRKYPALVKLKLEGAMLAPDIGFGIDFIEYPDNIMLQNGTLVALNALVSSFKSRLLADEQELKRQVFSLIILRRLSPENSFTVAGGQTIGSSVSEFVSNQLSYWITQVDENLEIDVDLNSLDGDALNTFQLRLSYTFFDGRLRISRGGGFTNTTTNQSDFNSILGDWTLEYLLTSDGKFRAKMFNRLDQNSFMSLNNSTNETGFSIQYVKSFDQLADILYNQKNKRNYNVPPNENGVEYQEVDSLNLRAKGKNPSGI